MPCRSAFPVSSLARQDSANSALVPQRIDRHGDRTCSIGPRKHLLDIRSSMDLRSFDNDIWYFFQEEVSWNRPISRGSPEAVSEFPLCLAGSNGRCNTSLVA